MCEAWDRSINLSIYNHIEYRSSHRRRWKFYHQEVGGAQFGVDPTSMDWTIGQGGTKE